MAEYIDREAAIKMLRGSAIAKYTLSFYFGILASADELEKMPAADVAPVRNGRWIIDGVYVVCSVCNRLTLSPIVKQLPAFAYCPNCGARMDLEEKNGKSENVWYAPQGDSE